MTHEKPHTTLPVHVRDHWSLTPVVINEIGGYLLNQDGCLIINDSNFLFINRFKILPISWIKAWIHVRIFMLTHVEASSKATNSEPTRARKMPLRSSTRTTCTFYDVRCKMPLTLLRLEIKFNLFVQLFHKELNS